MILVDAGIDAHFSLAATPAARGPAAPCCPVPRGAPARPHRPANDPQPREARRATSSAAAAWPP